MTKPRPPLSIDGALSRIAGQLPGSWKEMAAIVGKSESVVRRWGDQDAVDHHIPLPFAIALDIAFRRAGGEGRPLFETYALQVEVEDEKAFADEIALAVRACQLIREGAEASEAMVLASLPSASPSARERAIKELEDVARVVTGAIALLSPSSPEARPP